jgi:hypothetical protein
VSRTTRKLLLLPAAAGAVALLGPVPAQASPADQRPVQTGSAAQSPASGRTGLAAQGPAQDGPGAQSPTSRRAGFAVQSPAQDGPGAQSPASGRAKALLPGTAVPGASPGVRYTGTWRVWPGVVFRTFQTTGSGGPVAGDLLDVDLRDPHVDVGLLRPPAVAARERVSLMAGDQRAVAGVNGDFFNISETHPGVTPTGSSVGPEVAGGRAFKAAVPFAQRFGPAPPPGSTTEDVIGVGPDHLGRVSHLHLSGTVGHDRDRITLRGLNQYALPVGGVGAFTNAWGTVSRLRAVCGSDAARADPCSADTAEVRVRRGVVTAVSDAIGADAIPPDTTVLVGREAGADALRSFRPGDRVLVKYRLTGPERFRFALGGFPIRRDGTPPAGLDGVVLAGRTAAGVSRSGRHLYLVVVDGRSAVSTGMTLTGLSDLLGQVGADDAMNLDGGGSSTFALRAPGEPAVTVRNVPSDGSERPVANGIGVFTRS